MQDRPRLEKVSATDLPFDGGSFSHVWSQATICHAREMQKALQEACRVLAPGGYLVFDALRRPREDISDDARRFVYDRLIFDTGYSLADYQDALQGTGFRVLEGA